MSLWSTKMLAWNRKASLNKRRVLLREVDHRPSTVLRTINKSQLHPKRKSSTIPNNKAKILRHNLKLKTPKPASKFHISITQSQLLPRARPSQAFLSQHLSLWHISINSSLHKTLKSHQKNSQSLHPEHIQPEARARNLPRNPNQSYMRLNQSSHRAKVIRRNLLRNRLWKRGTRRHQGKRLKRRKRAPSRSMLRLRSLSPRSRHSLNRKK